MGSLSPTFVPARHVRLAVKLPSAFTLLSGGCHSPIGNLWAPPVPFRRRPPQSNYPPGHVRAFFSRVRDKQIREWYFTFRLHPPPKANFSGSHLSYARIPSSRDQAVVKLHGVFLSCRGEPVSSRVFQFRRVLCRDSAQLVTPFVRVGTYPTRNFATLGPL